MSQQPQLTPAQALELTAKVFANTQGNLQDHRLLQEVLRVIEAALAPKPEAIPMDTSLQEARNDSQFLELGRQAVADKS